MPSPIYAPFSLNNKLIPRRIIAGAILGLAITAKAASMMTAAEATPTLHGPALDRLVAIHVTKPVSAKRHGIIATKAQQAALTALIEHGLDDQAVTVRLRLSSAE